MEQKKGDQLYNMKAVEMDQRAVELAEADEATRRALNVAIKDYNQALVSRSSTHYQYLFTLTFSSKRKLHCSNKVLLKNKTITLLK